MNNKRFIFSLAAALSMGVAVAQSDLKAHTICLKDPAAENVTGFFAATTLVNFEVFKVGSQEDITRIVNSFKKDKAVQDVIVGALTGEFQAFTLILKEAKNKVWFGNLFKQAGLDNIRINRHEIVPVDKM